MQQPVWPPSAALHVVHRRACWGLAHTGPLLAIANPLYGGCERMMSSQNLACISWKSNVLISEFATLVLIICHGIVCGPHRIFQTALTIHCRAHTVCTKCLT